MSSLDQIKIVKGMENRPMVHSILREIAALLERYLEKDIPGELDLQSLPLTEVDREALYRALGQGEITMQLSVMGESEITETAFAGVWRVLHRDQEGRKMAEVIEIRSVPAIVAADSADLKRSVEKIKAISDNN